MVIKLWKDTKRTESKSIQETVKSRQDDSASFDTDLQCPMLREPSNIDRRADFKPSPTSEEYLEILKKSLESGQASLVKDSSDRIQVQYNDILIRNASKRIICNANTIGVPNAVNDFQMMVEALRESISYFKTSKPVSGVLLDLDKTNVSLHKGLYREGKEFVKTKNVLGVGSVPGNVVVYRDIKTHNENALKTISLEAFRIEEIKAWIALAGTSIPPALYLIRLENNNVEIFMEKIAEGMTLLEIINTYWGKIKDANLHTPFSFYVLDGILNAIVLMCERQVVHGDIHAGNIMIQKHPKSKLTIRILDFGKARFLDGTQRDDYGLFQSDIRQTIRIFSALYCGQHFSDDWSLREPNLRREELEKVTLRDEQRTTLRFLIDRALETTYPKDLPKFQMAVDEKRRSETVNEQIDDAMMDQFADLLFPGVTTINGDPNENQEKESGDLDSSDTLDQMSHHSVSVANVNVDATSVQQYPSNLNLLLQDIRMKPSRTSSKNKLW